MIDDFVSTKDGYFGLRKPNRTQGEVTSGYGLSLESHTHTNK